MNGARLLRKKRTVNAARVNNNVDCARRCCEGSAKRVLRIRRKLAKRRDMNPWTDDEITADRTTRTGLNAKVRVENNVPRGDDVNMCGNHLTMPAGVDLRFSYRVPTNWRGCETCAFGVSRLSTR